LNAATEDAQILAPATLLHSSHGLLAMPRFSFSYKLKAPLRAFFFFCLHMTETVGQVSDVQHFRYNHTKGRVVLAFVGSAWFVFSKMGQHTGVLVCRLILFF
jgi:hypothetical protein